MSRIQQLCLALLLFAPAVLSAASAPSAGWFFLPCGAKPHAEIAKLSPAQFARCVACQSRKPYAVGALRPAVPAGNAGKDKSPREPFWRPACFPHAEFDSIQPQSNVYGWYGCLVTVRKALEGRDLVLDLGVIDDADNAYVNGVEVGTMGSFEDVGKSGWCRDRRYRVPSKLLKPGPKNLVLVQVKDFWGLGGMVGPPVIGATVVAPYVKWQFLSLGSLTSLGPAVPAGNAPGPRPASLSSSSSVLDLTHLNTIARLPDLPSAGWTDVPIPDTGWDTRQKGNNVFGIYRLRFILSLQRGPGRRPAFGTAARIARLPGPVLDLGPVYDVTAVYLNGVRIAQFGRFPEAGRPAFVQTAKRLRCFVPVDRLRADGKPNDLVVIVYNTVQRGGLPGIPIWVWRFPARAAFAPGVSACFELTDLYAAAGDFRGAWACIDRLAQEKLSPVEDATFKSKQVWLYWLEAQANPKLRAMRIPQALAVFQNLWAEYSNQPVSQNAMQVFCAILRRAGNDPATTRAVHEFFPAITLASAPMPSGARGRASTKPQAKAGPRGTLSPGPAVPAGNALPPSAAPVSGQPPFVHSASQGTATPNAQTNKVGGLEGVDDSLQRGPGQRSAPSRPSSPAPMYGAVRYLGPDRTTRGDWLLEYGAESYVLAAWCQVIDQPGGLRLRWQLGIPGDRDHPRRWLASWNRAVSSVRALINPGEYIKALTVQRPHASDFLQPLFPDKTIRRAAWWDDHGEQHAFDEQGPGLQVRIAVPPGLHRLSFYCVDYDWGWTEHPRQQSVALFDAEGRLLNAAWTGKFGAGVYERFAVRGPLDLTARFFKHRSACVAVSGFFLDRIRPLPSFEAFDAMAWNSGDARRRVSFRRPFLRELDAGAPTAGMLDPSPKCLAYLKKNAESPPTWRDAWDRLALRGGATRLFRPDSSPVPAGKAKPSKAMKVNNTPPAATKIGAANPLSFWMFGPEADALAIRLAAAASTDERALFALILLDRARGNGSTADKALLKHLQQVRHPECAAGLFLTLARLEGPLRWSSMAAARFFTLAESGADKALLTALLDRVIAHCPEPLLAPVLAWGRDLRKRKGLGESEIGRRLEHRFLACSTVRTVTSTGSNRPPTKEKKP